MILFIIIGLVVGVALGRIEGAVFGAFIGFLLWRTIDLKESQNKLEEKIEQLKSKLTHSPKETGQADIDKAFKQAVFHDSSESRSGNESMPVKAAPPDEDSQSIERPEPKEPIKTFQAQTTTPKPPKLEQEVKPDIFEHVRQLAISYFTKGNLMVRMGIIVLFFGVAFLLKYASERSLIPLEIRLTGVTLGGLVLLTIGWRLRSSKRLYGLILQGGGVGILYLTIFAGMRLYQLVPVSLAFPLLIIFSLLAMSLAVLQDSRSLAAFAIAGGFLAPILTSTGEGSHVALFCYYALLDLCIFGVAWFKTWRILNLIGFIFTFVIGTAWGVSTYSPAFLPTTEPFLILFFILFTCIAILFAFKQKPALKGYVDGTLVFGTPIICFGLQASLVHDIDYGIGWSAFVLGMFYLLLASWLFYKGKEQMKVLSEAFFALAVIFISLAIPLAVDGHWTAAAYAIEGGGLLWIGLRQHRVFAKLFGIAIQPIGGILFLFQLPYIKKGLPLLNSEYMGISLMSVAGLFSAYFLNNYQEQAKHWEKSFGAFFIIWAFLWYYVGGFYQFEKLLPHAHVLSAVVFYTAISGLIYSIIEHKFSFKELRFNSWITAILLVFLAIFFLVKHDHPFAELGYIAWPLSFILLGWILYNQDKNNVALEARHIIHILTYCLMIAMLSMELYFQLDQTNVSLTSWGAAVLAIPPLIGLALIIKINLWPITLYQEAYIKWTGLIMFCGLFLWSILFNFISTGDPSPLPYLPLLNPLDIIQTLVVFVAILWWLRQSKEVFSFQVEKRHLFFSLFIFIFTWLNVVLLRTIHFWAGIDYRPDAMYESFMVQSSLAIFWTLIGLTLMMYAARKNIRPLWITGASLLGVVVVKLFLIDLSGTGTIERIISFIVVGVLLLLVGYFSPIPPLKTNPTEKNNDTIST